VVEDAAHACANTNALGVNGTLHTALCTLLCILHLRGWGMKGAVYASAVYVSAVCVGAVCLPEWVQYVSAVCLPEWVGCFQGPWRNGVANFWSSPWE
jgi:hypothetical protein